MKLVPTPLVLDHLLEVLDHLRREVLDHLLREVLDHLLEVLDHLLREVLDHLLREVLDHLLREVLDHYKEDLHEQEVRTELSLVKNVMEGTFNISNYK